MLFPPVTLGLTLAGQKSFPLQSVESTPKSTPETKDSKETIVTALYHKQLLAELTLNRKVSFSLLRLQLVFVLVALIALTTATLFFLSPANLFPKWYIATVILMLLFRITDYTQKKEHFFLIDFCYTVGLQILFFLIWRFHSVHLATRTFGLGAGVLGWSTVLFSNGLTLHRLDEACSLWIHTVPSLLAYTLRWTNEVSVIYHKNTSFVFGSEHILQYYVACYAPYVVWATGYYLAIAKAFKNLTIDGDYMTLIKFVIRKSPKISRLLNIFGPKRQTEAFMLYHGVFFTVATFVSYICFFNRPLHSAFLAVQVLSAVFHGGKMLADDIGRPYLAQVDRINSMLISLG
eukprot:TRINITY_DN7845_c0_g1_i1.p1 TRINITY_DN7845_c0_g1~~TRINITY_DN7845_c0_g1_i1.p1  ORF type:complete len:347 (-),score=67.41 TRINITY_DN7845_c0_g1_i1:137-1177(-)